jgi:hypothetical protein
MIEDEYTEFYIPSTNLTNTHKNTFLINPSSPSDQSKLFLLIPIDLNSYNPLSIQTEHHPHNNLDFLLMKNSLNFVNIDEKRSYPKSRKFSRDSFNKKIKRMFLNYLRENTQRKFGISLPKFSQRIITTASISYNKKLFKCSIADFFSNFCQLNLSRINEKKFESEKIFLDKNLKDVYIEDYLNSKEFYFDFKVLQKKEESVYCRKFLEVARSFIDYYMYLKPHQKKLKPSSNYIT